MRKHNKPSTIYHANKNQYNNNCQLKITTAELFT